MNKRIKIYIIITFWSCYGYAQADSIPMNLAGIIYDTTQTTPNVHIINLRTGRGVTSDSIGFFKTEMLKTDSLLFRCIGFEDKYFTVHDSILSATLFVEIRLTETSYFLDVIDVWALSRLKQFQYEFTNMPLPDNAWENQMIIPGVTKKSYKWIHEDERYIPIKNSVGSPITAIYNAFSDREQSIRKYLDLINNEEGDRLIDEKFNMKLLGDFTGFTGDTLIDFKLFLNYSRSFLLTHYGYHIFMDVKGKLPEFKRTYFSEEK